MILKGIIEAKLIALKKPFTISGDEIRTTCLNPDHKDNRPSFFINTSTGKNHCFSCGYTVHPNKFLGDELDADELLRTAKYTYIEDLLKDEEAKDELTFILPPKAYDIDRDWRGVSKELLQALGVYYCDTGRYAGRLVFPIYDKDKKLVGCDARVVKPDIAPEKLQDVKWLRPKGMVVQDICYPYEYLKTIDCKHIVLCEGVADCISYLELGIASIPSFGVAPPGTARITQLLNLGVQTLSIAFDNDDAGRKASSKVFKDYVKWFDIRNHPTQYKIIKSGAKDCNEYLNIIKKRG